MEWIEVDPLPAECVGCQAEECYNCDTAGLRWVLSEAGRARLKQKMVDQAIDRSILQLHRAYAELDRLAAILKK